MNKAVADGVNVLSISLGGVSSYSHDSIPIAAFGAMEPPCTSVTTLNPPSEYSEDRTSKARTTAVLPRSPLLAVVLPRSPVFDLLLLFLEDFCVAATIPFPLVFPLAVAAGEVLLCWSSLPMNIQFGEKLAIFWSTSSTQPGVLSWGEGYYNGDIKTRKTSQGV
ncbi:endoglucanase 3, partial [Stylosanthes scabra]|nr:endoglucanase 3 [Stylosanthes scabra]